MDLLSIYAAVISTLVGGWAIYGIRRDRDSLKVEVQFGYLKGTRDRPFFLTTPHREEASDDETHIVLHAVNTGRRPISLTGGGFYYRDTRTIFSGDGAKQYPMTLTEGRSGRTSVLLSNLKQSFRESGAPIGTYFDSESGRTYKGKIPKAIIEAIRAA